MGTVTQHIAFIAKQLNIPTEYIDEFETVLLLHFPKKDHFIVNTKLGLISNAEEYLGKDKAFQYSLLKNAVSIPETNSYLDSQSQYGKFATLIDQSQIASDILGTFSLPCIVKRNQGSQGSHVFLVKNAAEVSQAIAHIFNLNSHEYDYVLLAQRYIAPVHEYRVIMYHNQIAFAYLKDNANATFKGNLSPLHWEKSKAVLVTDNSKIVEFQKLGQNISKAWSVEFAGLDVIEDKAGTFWLIEVNTNPSMALFEQDNGARQVLELYTKILTDLQVKYA